MDPVQILTVVVFILFSLVQLFLEKRGSSKPPPPLEDEDTAVLTSRREADRSPVEVDSSWSPESQDWSEQWVEDAPGELPAREEGGVEAPATVEGYSRVDETPEAERVYLPVVSLEPLVVNRAAEHGRFHRPRLPVEVAVPVASPPAERLLPNLRGRAELRRAILVSEVLGPPRSLR